ncbi:MAG: heparan-alpha-glucosaminide N-acetyltransferase domain-containing protein, partial [Bacteroidales bacterium]
MKRIDAIDFVRGLVMIIMALDHTRDFIHVSSLTQNPLDPETTTPVLFFTRWITHFCAPVFVFLSGTSAYLSIKNRNNYKLSRNFLITRGLWLIVLEFTVINFALWYDLHFRILLFQVIAAIGFGFVILAFLIKLPSGVLGIIALIIIFGHNFLSPLLAGNDSLVKQVLSPLVNFSSYRVAPNFSFFVAYPFIPWFGIMLAGFATGHLFELPEAGRKRLFLVIGSAALLLFAGLRLINVFGDPSPWSEQKNSIYTFLSFLNTSKYPPSLLFILMTLGGMFLVLSFTMGIKGKLFDLISVFGKVPFFYYLIHLYLIHSVMIAILLLQG